MKNIIYITLFLSFLTSASDKPILIVGDENYLPIIGNENKMPQGFLIDKLKAIEKNSKIKFQISLYPWARALDLSSKESVGIIGISWNKKRDESYDFSNPIYTDSILIITKKGQKFEYKDLNDFKNKNIGAQINASYGEEFDSFAALNKLKIERDSDRVSRLQKLLHDHVDIALIGNGIFGFEKIIESNEELKKHRNDFIIQTKTLTEDKLFLAFDKKLNQKENIKNINDALKKLK